MAKCMDNGSESVEGKAERWSGCLREVTSRAYVGWDKFKELSGVW